MSLTATIDWKPFSVKHKNYIRNAMKCKMSVAEGAIRSGKTIDNCIIACMYLETCPDKIHLASGSTIANAKMNIGDCNGYGLEHLFRGRCKWGKYKENDCLRIQTKTGEKIVIFVGGGKADSFKKILGNSYGLWIATEINQHYDADESETSFIKVAFGRQVASREPKILWDLNPSSPKHKIYTDYIDRYKSGLLGGYNYQHFTIADNLSVSEERRIEIESQYDINSLWYRRDILGQRCVAEGIIYRQFADMPDLFERDLQEAKEKLLAANIGVDFGGTGSATTFVCTERQRDGICVLLSERHEEELNPEELTSAFVEFVKKAYAITGRSMYVYADSAEQILIRGLRNAVLQLRLPCIVRNALKRPIIDRIHFLCKLMASGRFGFCSGAETVKRAICEAQWDSKHPDRRLDDGTTDIDSMDALEYSFEAWIDELTRL